MLPLWIRKFAVDFIETAVAAVLVLDFIGDPFAVANAAITASGVALLAAARRNAGDFYLWVREQFGVSA